MKNVVVGIDAGDRSKHAASRAAELARLEGATLHLVTVVGSSETKVVGEGPERWFVNSAEEADRMVKEFVAGVGRDLDHRTHTVTGDPAEQLVDIAKAVDADLLVVGNHRMQGLVRLLGSVGQDVLAKAPCDVLVVKTS